MSSLKGNIILNFINTITGIIFPVITFPYASRILLPEGIGAVNFLSSIVNYIVLFTSLGIPMYAVREIAKFRDNIDLRNKITVEITLLSIILCLLGYVVVFILAEFVPRISAESSLFYILSLTILFTGIGVNWFYQGVEDFKFITIRAIIIRSLAAISLFIFVKDKSDLLIYGAITVGSTVGNNLINFIHLRKYIDLAQIKWPQLQIAKHIKPAIHIFVLNVIISIYVNLNSVMLGFMQGDEAVGLYTAGNKIAHVILSVVASLGVVMIPRCSNLVEAGNMNEFGKVIVKATRLVICLALPSMVGLMLLAYPVIYIFCGDNFINAVPVLYWTAPIILFVGLTNIIGLQALYPQNKENIVIWSTLGGALFNLILNIILIPLYSEVGAAIATFVAELTVLIIQLIIGYEYIPFKLKSLQCKQYFIATVIMAIVLVAVLNLISNLWIKVIFSVLMGGGIYMGYLLYKKDDIVISMLKIVLRK